MAQEVKTCKNRNGQTLKVGMLVQPIGNPAETTTIIKLTRYGSVVTAKVDPPITSLPRYFDGPNPYDLESAGI